MMASPVPAAFVAGLAEDGSAGVSYRVVRVGQQVVDAGSEHGRSVHSVTGLAADVAGGSGRPGKMSAKHFKDIRIVIRESVRFG